MVKYSNSIHLIINHYNYSLQYPTTGFISIRGWTGPPSLAITEGIPVGFFSTADWYA